MCMDLIAWIKSWKGLNIVMSENSFNPVVGYLEQLKWDGKKRIENLLADYLGVGKKRIFRNCYEIVYVRGN